MMLLTLQQAAEWANDYLQREVAMGNLKNKKQKTKTPHKRGFLQDLT